jgi:nucleotide-binding universal stress UspA family protein
MKKILCPVDFSQASLNALEFAVALAGRFGSELHLLNVYTEADLEQILRNGDVGQQFHFQLETAEKKLEAIRDEIRRDAAGRNIRKVECAVKTGNLADVLAETSSELRPDLIVVGTTGASKLRERYFGSKALNLIRHATHPVLCVPESHVYEGIHRMVYASDYQEEDKIAIPFAASLAAALGAHLEVLHISHHDQIIDRAIYKEFLLEIRDFVQYDAITFSREVFHPTVQGIVHHMNQTRSDLLVLLDKHRSRLGEIFHHSLTQDLSLLSAFPFLVVRL